MFARLFLVLTLLIIPQTSFAKVRVVTSIAPIATLFSMIAEDKAEIFSLTSSSGCPHHYSLKPSDLKHASNADLFVYIDNTFDTFALLLAHKAKADILRISDINGLKLEKDNWHIWLLPENAEAILKVAASKLSALSPQDKEFFEANLAKNLHKMEILSRRRMAVISNIKNLVLLTDSAEYLFAGTEVLRLYKQDDYASIRMTNQLKELAKDRERWFVISSNQSLSKYRNLLNSDSNIVQLDTENWMLAGDLGSLYYRRYEEILDKMSACGASQKNNYLD